MMSVSEAMDRARHEGFDWSTRCRQRFIGYKPCCLEQNHAGRCASPDGVAADFVNRSERVSVDESGRLRRFGSEYVLEVTTSSAALAEAKLRLKATDKEIETLTAFRTQLRAVIRARGKCTALPWWSSR